MTITRKEFTETTSLASRIESYVGQYNFIIQTPVQEYICNSLDAYRDNKIKLKKDQKLMKAYFEEVDGQEYFCLRDYAGGMDIETFARAINFGGSHKEDDGSTLGKFGLGFKSAFAYSPYFNFINFHEGKKIFSKACIEGYIEEHNPVDANEENGIMVMIPVKKEEDKLKFMKAVVRTTALWKKQLQPEIPETYTSLWDEFNIIKKFKNFTVVRTDRILHTTRDYGDNGYFVEVKGVIYELDYRFTDNCKNFSKLKELFGEGYSVILKTKLELEVKRDREYLKEHDENIENVDQVFNKAYEEYKAFSDEQINNLANSEKSFLKQYASYIDLYKKKSYMKKRKLETPLWDIKENILTFKNEITLYSVYGEKKSYSSNRTTFSVSEEPCSRINLKKFINSGEKIYFNDKRSYKPNTIKNKIKNDNAETNFSDSKIFYYLATGESNIFSDCEGFTDLNKKKIVNKSAANRKDKFNVFRVSDYDSCKGLTIKNKGWYTIEAIKSWGEISGQFFDRKKIIFLEKTNNENLRLKIRNFSERDYLFKNYIIVVATKKNIEEIKPYVEHESWRDATNAKTNFELTEDWKIQLRYNYWRSEMPSGSLSLLTQLSKFQDSIFNDELVKIMSFYNSMNESVHDLVLDEMPYFVKREFSKELGEKGTFKDIDKRIEDYNNLIKDIPFFAHVEYDRLAQRCPEELLEYMNFALTYKDYKHLRFLLECKK